MNTRPQSTGTNATLLSAALLFSCILASRADSPSDPALSKPAPALADVPRSRPAKVEAFALIGTGSYPGGAVACFDGNSAEFKTSLHPGEKIGGCTVAEVGFAHVKLRTGDREFDLPMAKQLRRENGGEWQLLALTERFTPANQPAAREADPAPQARFVPPPPENRRPTESDRGPSEKQLRKLDRPPDDGMKLEKESKSDKRAGEEMKLLQKVEKAVRREK